MRSPERFRRLLCLRASLVNSPYVSSTDTLWSEIVCVLRLSARGRVDQENDDGVRT
jgi:hypothetical protein